MKISVFFSNDPTAGWNMGQGIVNVLRRMGHSVIPGPLPTVHEANEQMVESVKTQSPRLDTLSSCDLILVSGPEHISPWIALVYGKQTWKELGIPKACWLHESCNRDDYQIDFDTIRWCGDEWFFPAIQDAEFHDQEMFVAGRSHWLPFGVDTEIFKPTKIYAEGTVEHQKNFDIAFIGLMYPKRQVFLRALNHHDHPPIRIGMVSVNDLHGYHLEESIRLLASDTRQIKVFFNMPAMSRLIVSKVYETMACGTFLLTPEIPEYRGAEKNMAQFEHGKHLITYSPSNMPYIAQLLRDWVSPEKDAKRAAIAEAGCREVHAHHTLKHRLAEILITVVKSASLLNKSAEGAAQ